MPGQLTGLKIHCGHFMQIFWQVNQSLQGKYTYSGHFRKQLTAISNWQRAINKKYKNHNKKGAECITAP